MKIDTRSLFTISHRAISFSFLLLFSFFFLKSNAQEATQTKLGIRGGIVFGMDAAQVDGDDFAGYHKVGINGGFYGAIPVSKIFFFSTEILYVQDGGKAPTVQGQVLQYRSQFSYAQIPILFHYQGKEAFNVGAGFEYGRLLSQRIFANEIEQPKASICTGPPQDVSLLDPQYICLRKNDFRAVADANYLFSKHFMVNVRFSYSIVPFGYYGGSNFINRGMYHNVLTFRLMYVFGG